MGDFGLQESCAFFRVLDHHVVFGSGWGALMDLVRSRLP
jgi:hypothetical protein